MNEELKKEIEKEYPFYFELLGEIEKIEDLGYVIERIYVSKEQSEQLTGVDILLHSAGLPLIIVRTEENNYFKDAILNEFGESLAFTILKEDESE